MSASLLNQFKCITKLPAINYKCIVIRTWNVVLILKIINEIWYKFLPLLSIMRTPYSVPPTYFVWPIPLPTQTVRVKINERQCRKSGKLMLLCWTITTNISCVFSNNTKYFKILKRNDVERILLLDRPKNWKSKMLKPENAPPLWDTNISSIFTKSLLCDEVCPSWKNPPINETQTKNISVIVKFFSWYFVRMWFVVKQLLLNCISLLLQKVSLFTVLQSP